MSLIVFYNGRKIMFIQLRPERNHYIQVMVNNGVSQALVKNTEIIEKQQAKTKMSEETIIEALIAASKWGSWAYDLKERDRQGKTKLKC